MTVHTGPGCSMLQPDNQLLSCESTSDSNSGCPVTDPDNQSFGSGFNSVGGGVFAHQWTSTGILIWRWTRKKIPPDITKKNPDPTQWGDPVAKFLDTNCDIASHFLEHHLVLDTTICGAFAGNFYGSSGCPETCEQATGDPTHYKSELS